MNEISVAVLLQQLAIAIPSIMLGTQTITAALHGIFNIQNDNVNHAISWIVAILAGLGFVQFNGLTFGFGGWDYAVGGICGLVAGGAANGFYDWPSIKSVFDAITNLFTPKSRKNKK